MNAKDVTGLCHRVSVRELPPLTPSSIINALESDFADTKSDDKSISQEDICFLQILKGGILQNELGHLEMPLPFKVRPHLTLNDHLLTGPNLTNGLTAVLCRFLKHPIAVIFDVEKMFHRFHVSKEGRDYLRFLWWENRDTNSEPTEHRMKVHLFGASSSPGCANYGMKHLASQNEKECPSAASFIRKHFYVDDGLISLKSVGEAIEW